MNRETEYYIGLVQELRKLPKETEWAEFKKDNDNPQEIGEYISALSNSAAFNGKTHGYMLWGIENETHDLVGTAFKPFTAKKGNEPLENWLCHLLTPAIHFIFHEVSVEGEPVVILEIPRASKHPVSFAGIEYIRIGEVKKALKGATDREAELWRIFDKTPFEELVAAERVSAEDVLQLLDYPAYFDLLEIPLPSNRDGILDALAEDGLICRCNAGGWNITNLGAILFAKRLDKFKTLRRKAIRVIRYTERGRTET
jgi:predicted HTH transcriptional regulator